MRPAVWQVRRAEVRLQRRYKSALDSDTGFAAGTVRTRRGQQPIARVSAHTLVRFAAT